MYGSRCGNHSIIMQAGGFHLQKTQPTEGYQYDEAKRSIAKHYEDAKLTMGFLNGTLIPLAFCVTLLLSDASRQLANAVELISGSYWIDLGSYVATFVIGLQLVALPLTFYSGFVVDHRFQLSTQTIRGWIVDTLKEVGIELIFAILAATVLYYLIENVAYWWIAAAVIFAAFSILLSIILPFVFLPIFYKVNPLSDVQLKEGLLQMTKTSGVSNIDRVLVADESRRSIRANAFFSGVGKSKSIVLFDTLLNNFTHREITTVVAHELGHYVNKDIWKEALTTGLLIIPPFFIIDIALRYAVRASIITSMIDPAGIPIVFSILIGVTFGLQPVSNAISRSVERQADVFALKVAKDPEAQASTERRLADLSLSVDSPNRLVELFFYTHPPSSQRIKLAENWNKTVPASEPNFVS